SSSFLCFLFSMLLRSPRSTLFPYTTLFRSELCFEGLRKDDLVRWGDFYRNMKNILLEVPTGTTLVLRDAKEIYTNASERDIIWPIPASELGVNKKLRQNSGW